MSEKDVQKDVPIPYRKEESHKKYLCVRINDHEICVRIPLQFWEKATRAQMTTYIRRLRRKIDSYKTEMNLGKI